MASGASSAFGIPDYPPLEGLDRGPPPSWLNRKPILDAIVSFDKSNVQGRRRRRKRRPDGAHPMVPSIGYGQRSVALSRTRH